MTTCAIGQTLQRRALALGRGQDRIPRMEKYCVLEERWRVVALDEGRDGNVGTKQVHECGAELVRGRDDNIGQKPRCRHQAPWWAMMSSQPFTWSFPPKHVLHNHAYVTFSPSFFSHATFPPLRPMLLLQLHPLAATLLPLAATLLHQIWMEAPIYSHPLVASKSAYYYDVVLLSCYLRHFATATLDVYRGNRSSWRACRGAA